MTLLFCGVHVRLGTGNKIRRTYTSVNSPYRLCLLRNISKVLLRMVCDGRGKYGCYRAGCLGENNDVFSGGWE